MLSYATENYPFNFHPRCAHIKLCHLMFADDLLLFCKGDKASIMTLLRAFSTFSKSSGLKMSPGNSNAYFNGMVSANKEEILSVSVCTPKKEGGLGLKNIQQCNIAAVGKLVWWVYAKPDKLWVQWISHVYLKGTPWTDYRPTADSSWSWRKICQGKEELKQGFNQGIWYVNPTEYRIRNGYNLMRTAKPKVEWFHLVWHNCAVPKHRFIAWLVHMNALNTRHKLKRIGVSDSSLCCICEKEEETIQHLFFDCEYSRKVMGRQRNACRLEYKFHRPENNANEIRRMMTDRCLHLIKAPIHRTDANWLKKICQNEGA
ncbi:uncharacterized protein LOC141631886 [Silene latifolia]|uniref:uncharacterized protein LOC141631886 n=1 Tax=Silene latifolia TaxID=37657 RepID=UPI003D78AAA7